MRIILVSVGDRIDYRVVAVFAASKFAAAAKVARLVGGRVETEDSHFTDTPFPLHLNQFPAAKLPMGAKAFYHFEVTRAGKIDDLYAAPLLNGDGSLKQPRYSLDSYATRTAARDIPGGIASVRKSHWRLHVACYADSEKTAKEIGLMLKDDVFAKKRPAEGTL